MLVETGYWPPQIPFDLVELNTVVEVINENRKQARRVR